jgi:hypothetical protein
LKVEVLMLNVNHITFNDNLYMNYYNETNFSIL